jgi:hypothetical protein
MRFLAGTVGINDPYAASDYLLSRLFEAGKQLERLKGIRIAACLLMTTRVGQYFNSDYSTVLSIGGRRASIARMK